MITISAIYTYPVKSCRGLAHERHALDARGLRYDRRWMVARPDGQFLTARDVPRLLRVQPEMGHDVMRLHAAGHPVLEVPLEQDVRGRRRMVEVWGDRVAAVDEGEAAAAWFSAVVGLPVRLVSIADDFSRVIDTEYVDQPTETGFADGYPLLLIGEASLDALNERLRAKGEAPVPMSRFRPNVVVRGTAPFAEDTWRRVRMGDVPFDVVKPCKRCVITTLDPQTGEAPNPKEPTATLASFRRWKGGVIFGQNVVHRSLGVLRVGQPVTVEQAAHGWLQQA
jgi:uncharacterized protein YcbX